jgi:enoyl-CoA hydratase/carnithine racemase
LNPQPLTARTAHEWGVVAEVVPNGKALSRARELAELYLKAPEVTRRNTRIHFIQPLKERIVREVGYGLSLEGASSAALMKSMQAKNEPVARKGKGEALSIKSGRKCCSGLMTGFSAFSRAFITGVFVQVTHS